MTLEEVRLEVPASPEYLRMTRIMAAGVASRLGFTYDEVEDLRIAIDELCFALVGRDGRDGTLTVRYRLLDDGLAVEGSSHFEDGVFTVPKLSALSKQILNSVVEGCQLMTEANGPGFRFTKRRGTS